MYGDSHALSSDSSSIFSSNFKPKEEVAKNSEHQFLSMESDAYTNYNTGLLRYRSNFAEKSEKLGSRFCFDEVHVMGNDDNSCNNKGSVNRFAQLPPQYPRQSSGGAHLGSLAQSLVRQNSSPAGLFSHLSTSQNGYGGVRGIGSYRVTDCSNNNGDISSRFKNDHMNFSSGVPSSFSRITNLEHENSLNEVKVGNSSGDNLFSSSGFTFGSWNDSSYFAENFIKRELDNDQKMFVNNTEKLEPQKRPNILSHHLSLPKTSMEKLMHLQDTVPCKVRAKRGCATHPRSIAERVRRTRISERMRKLQDLVPNMDKQTNTADMLDLAVEYIKSLQKQYKTLSDNRANCKCSASS